MSDLRSIIKAIQGEVGAERDGVFGPTTAAAVLRKLRGEPEPAGTGPDDYPGTFEDLDPRSLGIIAGLDAKAAPKFADFLKRAKATAATLGCDYVLISGNRTFEEQNALYTQGRTTKGPIVTKARGGYSNHNFGIAVDAGVFRAGSYLDGSKAKADTELAAKVHKACSMHAAACGLEWGGSWKSIVDLPHYEVATGLTMAEKRKRFQEKGSVL